MSVLRRIRPAAVLTSAYSAYSPQEVDEKTAVSGDDIPAAESDKAVDEKPRRVSLFNAFPFILDANSPPRASAGPLYPPSPPPMRRRRPPPLPSRPMPKQRPKQRHRLLKQPTDQMRQR
jgi:hypothetical protein